MIKPGYFKQEMRFWFPVVLVTLLFSPYWDLPFSYIPILFIGGLFWFCKDVSEYNKIYENNKMFHSELSIIKEKLSNGNISEKEFDKKAQELHDIYCK